mgnify:CR=1 FL=1
MKLKISAILATSAIFNLSLSAQAKKKAPAKPAAPVAAAPAKPAAPAVPAAHAWLVQMPRSLEELKPLLPSHLLRVPMASMWTRSTPQRQDLAPTI